MTRDLDSHWPTYCSLVQMQNVNLKHMDIFKLSLTVRLKLSKLLILIEIDITICTIQQLVVISLERKLEIFRGERLFIFQDLFGLHLMFVVFKLSCSILLILLIYTGYIDNMLLF